MTTKYLNTVEELVALTMKYAPHASLSNTRWTLFDSTTWVWADEFLGAQWEEEYETFRSGSRPATHEDSDGWAKYYAAEAEWNWKHPQPEKVQKVHYHLMEQGRPYHRDDIVLGEELGHQIDNIWSKRTGRYGSYKQRVGGLTLAGIVKRLGMADIGDKINKARDLAQRQEEVRKRNHYRHQLLAAVADLVKIIGQAGDNGITLIQDWDLGSLTELKDEPTPEA